MGVSKNWRYWDTPIHGHQIVGKFANFSGTESASKIHADSDMQWLTCHCCEMTSVQSKLTACNWSKLFEPSLNSLALL